MAGLGRGWRRGRVVLAVDLPHFFGAEECNLFGWVIRAETVLTFMLVAINNPAVKQQSVLAANAADASECSGHDGHLSDGIILLKRKIVKLESSDLFC